MLLTVLSFTYREHIYVSIEMGPTLWVLAHIYVTGDILVRVEYQNVQVFTYGVSEQQQLEVLDGGDGTVSNQLHQSCRQRLPLKHNHTCKSVSTVGQSHSTVMAKNGKRHKTLPEHIHDCKNGYF